MSGDLYQRASRAEIAARVHAEEAVVPVDAREELEAAIWRHWPTRGPEAGKAVDAILAAADRYATALAARSAADAALGPQRLAQAAAETARKRP